MSPKISLWVGLIGIAATIPLVQTVAVAKPSTDYIRSALVKVKDFKGDYRGALADLNRLKLQPNDAKAYSIRGFLKADKLNDPQGGLADYNRAVSLKPNDAKTYFIRGLLKDDQLNDPQGGLADYNRAIALNPNDAKVYFIRGLLKEEKLQDVQGSLADYNRAIALDPNLAIAYGRRGILRGDARDIGQEATLQRTTNQYQKAIDTLKIIEDRDSQPIVTKPSNAEGYYRQGDQKADAGNYRQAIVDFSRSIALNAKGL